jgi:hypothetical protein
MSLHVSALKSSIYIIHKMAVYVSTRINTQELLRYRQNILGFEVLKKKMSHVFSASNKRTKVTVTF